jgi:type IV pilus assembly protein PilE
MKKAFTLLEIIVVLLIIGIIATLGFTQYTRVIEKGRTAEGKSNLGTIRTMAVSYYQENGSYPDNNYLANVLGLPTTSCNTNYYFRYGINSATGAATAYRCTSGGKQPNSSTAYNLTLTVDGVGSSSPSGWW